MAKASCYPTSDTEVNHSSEVQKDEDQGFTLYGALIRTPDAVYMVCEVKALSNEQRQLIEEISQPLD